MHVIIVNTKCLKTITLCCEILSGYVNLGRTHQGNLSGTQGAV
ncbi:hypothetical protein EDF50_0109 [Frigoribacterium sp. PhB24]|nr:hypothetical protein EDF50_0109 [Frigoribacterium sp. PhB24]